MKTMIKALFRHFFPPRRHWLAVPKQLVNNEYAGEWIPHTQERLLINFGVARDVDNARELMQKYSATTALEVLIRQPKRTGRTWRDRTKTLIQRMGGHQRGDGLYPRNSFWDERKLSPRAHSAWRPKHER